MVTPAPAELIPVSPRRKLGSERFANSYELQPFTDARHSDLVGGRAKPGGAERTLAFLDCLPPLFYRCQIPALTLAADYPEPALCGIEGESPPDGEVLDDFVGAQRGVTKEAGRVHDRNLFASLPPRSGAERLWRVGPICAIGSRKMQTLMGSSLARSLAIAVLVVAPACRSMPRNDDVSVVENGVIVNPAEHQLTLAAADSEVFAAVVRAQLGANDDEYPRRLERFRYDSRPYGTPTGYPEVFSGVQGIDPTLSYAKAEKRTVNRLVENRKVILEEHNVREGGALTYPQCAGASVPLPPPTRTRSAAAAKRADVHSGCPKTNEYYVTVGLPIRGIPPGLERSRDTRGRRVSVRGEMWTAVVEEHAFAPEGWRRSQYAWVFRRGGSGQLELVNTILIGVVQ